MRHLVRVRSYGSVGITNHNKASYSASTGRVTAAVISKETSVRLLAGAARRQVSGNRPGVIVGVAGRDKSGAMSLPRLGGFAKLSRI